jgi:hypothetical protein
MFFAGVAIGNRHLAFKSVYRWYRVTVQSVPGSITTISSIEQFDLDDILVSMATGTGNVKTEIHAFVKGTFYPYSDHFVNTGSCVHWAWGNFTLNRDTRCVEFPQPVYSAGSCISPATLYLCTGFRIRDPSTWEFVRHSRTAYREVGTGTGTPPREEGSGTQLLPHLELYETVSEPFTGACTNSGSPTKNTAAIDAEADLYLAAWKAHWDSVKTKRDIIYDGARNLPLSGNVAHLRWRIAGGIPPQTRGAENYEFTL